MLNFCPPMRSCGTYFPMWTDEEAPAEVLSLATISAYGRYYDVDCKHYIFDVQVMRCSLDTDYDLIYRLNGDYMSACGFAFCGMN